MREHCGVSRVLWRQGAPPRFREGQGKRPAEGYWPMAGDVTGPLVCVFQMTWPSLAPSA
jgi:hypothetical protein